MKPKSSPERVNMYFPVKGLARLLFPHRPLASYLHPPAPDPFTKDDYACFSTGEEVVYTTRGAYRKKTLASRAGPTHSEVIGFSHGRFLVYELETREQLEERSRKRSDERPTSL